MRLAGRAPPLRVKSPAGNAAGEELERRRQVERRAVAKASLDLPCQPRYPAMKAVSTTDVHDPFHHWPVPHTVGDRRRVIVLGSTGQSNSCRQTGIADPKAPRSDIAD